MTEKYQHVPREMMAEEEQKRRAVLALESIAVSLRTVCAYFQMLTEGSFKYATPKRKKAPSLASRNRKKRKG